VVSGQVPFESLAACAAAGADVVSIGAITDSAPAADIAFELQPE
jgi:nicotinate-nucleotide pyrophosphorylase